jgi:hypothetical protein
MQAHNSAGLKQPTIGTLQNNMTIVEDVITEQREMKRLLKQAGFGKISITDQTVAISAFLKKTLAFTLTGSVSLLQCCFNI